MLSSFLKSWGLLTGALFFFSAPVFSQTWTDIQWLRLLHYNKSIFGYVSEADGSAFFVHPDGKTNPDLELRAFAEGLSEVELNEKKSLVCRFPARVRWLKQHRKDFKVDDSHCTELNRFRDRLAAKSASVVFSSYYLNNPSSSFGHTFLRLEKAASSETSTRSELLDTGVNYGAMIGDSNPFVYAVGGITGFFYGSYNAIPYYYKVREYNDYETRDLWSYQLNLTPAEVEMAVDHIWELGNTLFEYYFLTENCSYHVLTILEVARPSLNLIRHMPRLYIIPSDTLKALALEDIITKITFRPAASTLFYHQLDLLKPELRTTVMELVDGKSVKMNLPEKEKALLYDTAISLVDYKYAKEILKQDEKAQAIKQPLLLARSKIPLNSPELNFSPKLSEAPHLGHKSGRVHIDGLRENDKNFTEVGWRFAYHDFLDYDVGYPPRTRIDVMKASLRNDGHHVAIHDAAVVDILSLGKWDRYTHSPSWKFKLGQWGTRRDSAQLTSDGVAGGYGYAYHFTYLTPYILAHGEASYVSERLHELKLAYGVDTGVIVDVNHHLKFFTALELRDYKYREDGQWLNEVRWSNQSFGIGSYLRRNLHQGWDSIGARLFFYLQ